MGKVRNSIKNEFDNEPLCNYKYLKTRIKPYHGKINIDFHNNKIPKEGSQCICLSVILIDSVFRTVNIIILKCFYKNVNILLRKKKMPEYITYSFIHLHTDYGNIAWTNTSQTKLKIILSKNMLFELYFMNKKKFMQDFF